MDKRKIIDLRAYIGKSRIAETVIFDIKNY